MLGGQSTAKGVVLYETKKSGATGVFCYFENDRPQWKTGDYKQLIEEQKTLTAPLCKSGTGKFFLNVLCNLILCQGTVYVGRMNASLIQGFNLINHQRNQR